MKDSLNAPPYLALKPSERDYGVIVTAVHADGPPLWTFHVPGGAGDALRQECLEIDARGDRWMIQAVSSPTSIFRDLQGTRQQHRERNYGGSLNDSPLSEDPRSFEIIALSKIGRLDLRAPLRRTS